MRKTSSFLLTLLLAFHGILLTGCAVRARLDTLHDFGTLHNMHSGPHLPVLRPISVADIHAPGWLDSTLMFYRLNYANAQQPRPYANSRWTMPPAQLFGQRLKARIAQAGGAALPAADGAANVPVLRIEVDDFIQIFDAPERSIAHVGLRAALFNGRTLIAQRTFVQQSPAPGADAAGGVTALAAASDAIISDMILWLATLPSMAK